MLNKPEIHDLLLGKKLGEKEEKLIIMVDDEKGLRNVVNEEDPIDKILDVKSSKIPFRIGKEYLLFSEGGKNIWDNIKDITKNKGKYFILKPGDTAIIKTREYIEIPNNIGGIMSSKLSFGSFGISHISTTLDPTFKGYLVLSFTNIGGYCVKFHHEDIIAYATLFKLQKIPENENKNNLKPDERISPYRVQKGTLKEILKEQVIPEELIDSPKYEINKFDDRKDLLKKIKKDSYWRGTPHDAIFKILQYHDNRISNAVDILKGVGIGLAIGLLLLITGRLLP